MTKRDVTPTAASDGRTQPALRRISCTPRGVALVTVLAVLTLLALLAVVFQVQTSVIVANSQDQTHVLQAQLLAQSGLEHACSMLRDDLEQQPAFDDESEAWAQAFAPDPARPADAADVDGLALPDAADARWINCRATPPCAGRWWRISKKAASGGTQTESSCARKSTLIPRAFAGCRDINPEFRS